MGFFKDYKETKDDVNETLSQPGSEKAEITDDMLGDNFDLEKYLQNNLDMDFSENMEEKVPSDTTGSDDSETVNLELKDEILDKLDARQSHQDVKQNDEPIVKVSVTENETQSMSEQPMTNKPEKRKEEKIPMNNDFSDIINEINATALQMDGKSTTDDTDFGVSQGGTGSTAAVGDGDTTIICRGLNVSGDIESNGSIELMGTVNGDVTCAGKLSVSGAITGESKCSEFFANKANVTGNVDCSGPAKVAAGSIILGNLNAKSAVIAGAVKGDVDVHGPVIIDSTAIVLGDIKSESIQIMLGAAVEGHCSQCYAENNPVSFFENLN